MSLGTSYGVGICGARSASAYDLVRTVAGEGIRATASLYRNLGRSDSVMSNDNPGGYAFLGIGLGLYTFLKGSRQFRNYRLIADTPEIPIRSIPMGFVATHGVAKGEQTVHCSDLRCLDSLFSPTKGPKFDDGAPSLRFVVLSGKNRGPKPRRSALRVPGSSIPSGVGWRAVGEQIIPSCCRV